MLRLLLLLIAMLFCSLACDTGNNGPNPPDDQLAADTLYAFAEPATVNVGEEVTVTVFTGVPAQAFQFMNGCGLTVDDDADKVAGTFNVGEPGGQPDASDGVWNAMEPTGGFLMPPDDFIVATPMAGGRERWDFNVTPIGGSDISAEGALFNYRFTFATAGTKSFSFVEFAGVDRTYYSDDASNLYHWSDITNATAPTVTVN